MPTVADLGRMVKQKYPGSQKYAAMDDAELGRAVKAKYPDAAAYQKYEDAPQPQAPVGFQNPVQQQIGAALPTLGGLAGGLAGTAIGGPGVGIAAAGLGGVLGEAGNAALTGQPITKEAALGEGAKQATLESLGLLTAGTARAVGRRAVSAFGRVSRPIARTLVREGVSVGPGGVAKLERINEKVGKEAARLFAEADEKVGKSIPVAKLVAPLQEKLARIQNRASREALEKMRDTFLKNHPERVTPSELRQIRGEFANLINYDKTAKKSGPITEQFRRMVAGQARRTLHELGDIGKRLEKVDTRYSDILKAQEKLPAAVNRSPGAGMGMMRPLGFLFDAPTAYTNAARLGLTNPIVQNLYRQLPRGAGALFAPPPIVEED